jgi:hypothetical protein
MDNDRRSFQNTVEDSDARHRHEDDEEALFDKERMEHDVPEPPPQTSFARVAFWIAVNTLATIGIVGFFGVFWGFSTDQK